MKKIVWGALLVALTFAMVLPVKAASLADNVRGKILLQVEKHDEAWYVNPEDDYRYYLGRPADAFNLMRELGLGINEANYKKFNGYAPANLAGRILLRVEARGEAYYVNPTNRKMYYLGRPADAFNVMRELGLGATTANLNRLTIRSLMSGTGSFSSSGSSSPTMTDTGASQFEDNFRACTPSTMISDLPFMGTAYVYQIIGAENGKCKVKNWYMKNPNDNWVNKTMTCPYDNTKSLSAAGASVIASIGFGNSGCSGELVDLFFTSANGEWQQTN